MRDTDESVIKCENNENFIENSEVQSILDKINEKTYDMETPDQFPLITYPTKNPLYTLYIVGKETMKKMFYGRF